MPGSHLDIPHPIRRSGKLSVQKRSKATTHSYSVDAARPLCSFVCLLGRRERRACPTGPCTVGSMRAPRARSARASLIFVRSCASPPGTACAALLYEPYYAPRGPRASEVRSTCGPRGAGGPSGPWGSILTCSAAASSVGREWTSCPPCPTRTRRHPLGLVWLVVWLVGWVGGEGVVRAAACTPTEPLGSLRVCKACARLGVFFPMRKKLPDP